MLRYNFINSYKLTFILLTFLRHNLANYRKNKEHKNSFVLANFASSPCPKTGVFLVSKFNFLHG